jgi:peptidoglycan/xylan/chitin deacetylase (PgdA/CDA1 family)
LNTIPILCYHAIQEGDGPMRIHPDRFRELVDVLAKRGAVSLSVDQVGDHIRTARPFPDRAICLTFDDGYTGLCDEALPVLAAAGFIATVFVVTGQIGGRAVWNGGDRHSRLLGRDELRELKAAGWEVGSHSHRHREMTALADSEIVDDFERSIDVLEDLLQQRPHSFAYPYGRHDARTRRAAGSKFTACLTVGTRRASLTNELDRIDRIEAWYVRDPRIFRRIDDAAGRLYLELRRLGRALGRRS